MEILSSLGLLAGGAWGSGINLYMTIAGLGIAQRMQWINLPGNLEIIAHPLIITVAILLYMVEFAADKIPYVDSTWDAIHTAIRPVGGAALGYLAMANAGPVIQIPIALLTGTVAADSHLTKATARAAINTSPEPVTNSVASVTEDISVAGIIYLIIRHPVIATIAVILFILFSIWFLKKMFRFVRAIFTGSKPQENISNPPQTE